MLKKIHKEAIYNSKQGRKIIDTNHSIERFYDKQRFKIEVDKKEFKNKVLSIINRAIIKILKKYKDKSNRYGIHSKSTGIGMIIHWRAEGDRNREDDKNHAIIITLLPIKKYHSFRDKDIALIVEDLLKSWMAFENVKIRMKKNAVDFSTNKFDVIFFEGKLWHADVDNFIIVD